MNILTFDIEEWFHILNHNSTKTADNWANYEYRLEENMDTIFNLLERNNQKATFFCLGWVAENFPNIIKKIDSYNYEIGTHSHMHQLAYCQSRKEFRDDLKKSIHSIEDIIGKKVRIYRAPGFSIKKQNLWVFQELIKNGIEIDCSIFPANRAHGGLPSYEQAKPSIISYGNDTLKEFPINTFNFFGQKIIFSGGGYFRLLPFELLKYLFKNSTYNMTYFHPRDFDSKQPMIEDLSLLRKFKSYYGLKYSLEKLDKVIKKFDFTDLRVADENIDWSKVQKIQL